MAALRRFYADDPEQDAADLAKAERELEQLQYAEPKNAAHREKIEAAKAALGRGIERMRRNA
jgi:hypothetical protein